MTTAAFKGHIVASSPEEYLQRQAAAQRRRNALHFLFYGDLRLGKNDRGSENHTPCGASGPTAAVIPHDGGINDVTCPTCLRAMIADCEKAIEQNHIEEWYTPDVAKVKLPKLKARLEVLEAEA